MPASAPLISIALAARNAAPTLPLALDSLLAQTFPDWELLLFDDGSSDGTLALMEGAGDPRVRVFAAASSRGLAVRLNQAIDTARGPLFARMDADDVAFPSRLERQVGFLQAHPEVDLLATGAIFIDGDNRPTGLFPDPGPLHRQICARPHAGFYFPHPTWMGRTAWFRRFRYREELRKAEDQDLLLRAYRDSRYARLPDPLLGYRQYRLGLGKAVASRVTSAQVLWRAFVAQGDPLTALRALFGQTLKGSVEVAAILTGLEQSVLQRRRRGLPVEVATAWQDCLDTLERFRGSPPGGP